MPATPEKQSQRGYIIPIGGAEGRRRKSAILSRFVELCGGADARIMVIPTASLLNETGPQYQALFKEMGAKSMCVPVETREECFDVETLRILGEASGIFITGGNQLRLSTILGGTPVARRIRSMNAQGVHVAGTSAGAAIVSEHMIAGGRSGPSPRESGVELAPGLGLTNRVIIDQHFNQRQRMGRLLANLGAADLDAVALMYVTELMTALARRATRKRHANTLQHMAGYLKRSIDSDDKRELNENIDAYRQGQIPLIVPITLFRHYFRRHPDPYMERQVYLHPHPDELSLRNSI